MEYYLPPDFVHHSNSAAAAPEMATGGGAKVKEGDKLFLEAEKW